MTVADALIGKLYLRKFRAGWEWYFSAPEYIIKPLSNHLDPIIEVSDMPSPPDFTIRCIISVIVSVGPTSYSVMINRPPTLEERMRRMQQVSTGVTVAYFSSIAVLALAAIQTPSSDSTGQETTYFDYVVFLSMFLLAGRYFEAYSKARTAEAITVLGSLRPAEALILSPRSASDSTTALVLRNDPEKSDVACNNGSFVASSRFKFEKVPVDLLEVGNGVHVQNGATSPPDGTIVSDAETSFNESYLTGGA
ncbi:hypothetical protein EDB19DRAFT_1971501 [Suillus lakei]|nr:hypothetical protein EDB19DRAFT_1971501 [Suillus lakei]